MRIKDLIKNKNYDYIEIRLTLNDEIDGETTFFGVCSSENGKLISVDGDDYDDEEEIIYYNEFKNETKNVNNGLSIILKGNWI